MPGLLDSSGNLDMAAVQGLLSQFKPSAADQAEARRQAIMMAGLGLLGTRRGQEGEAIGRAGMLGLTTREQLLRNAQEQQQHGIQSAAQLMQLQSAAQKMAEQQKLNAAMAEWAKRQAKPTTTMPSLAPTNANAALLANNAWPGNRDLYQRALAQADFLEQQGLWNEAQAIRMQAQEKFAPQYSGTKTVMQNGQAVLLQEYKNRPATTLEGYQPPPEVQMVPAGGSIIPVDKLRPPTAPIPVTMTPGEVASNAVARANLGYRGQEIGMQQQRLQADLANLGVNRTQELRKEFNALPQVKMYSEVQPIVQSAREASKTDTPAADLNLVYAAAKIMDPGSVVRESETSMVIATGSPAQKFLGQFNYIAGGGRLTPQVRAGLMNEIESRARGYESGYKAARQTYSGLADKLNVPKEDVFVEPFTSSQNQPKQGSNLTPAEQAELDQLRKRFGRH